MSEITKQLVIALRACIAETSPAEHAETVNGAANLTAWDWVERAVATLREADDGDNGALGDALDDLGRALLRMGWPRQVLATYDAAQDRVREVLLNDEQREQLVGLLVDDQVSSALGDRGYLPSVFRHGTTGFEKMDDAVLLDAYVDAFHERWENDPRPDPDDESRPSP